MTDTIDSYDAAAVNSPDIAAGAFQSIDLRLAAANLAELHERVAMTRGRIEITREGLHESCVLISRTELESLELGAADQHARFMQSFARNFDSPARHRHALVQLREVRRRQSQVNTLKRPGSDVGRIDGRCVV